MLRAARRRASDTESTRELYGEGTIETHVSSILATLGLRDRVQAVVCGLGSGT